MRTPYNKRVGKAMAFGYVEEGVETQILMRPHENLTNSMINSIKEHIRREYCNEVVSLDEGIFNKEHPEIRAARKQYKAAKKAVEDAWQEHENYVQGYRTHDEFVHGKALRRKELMAAGSAHRDAFKSLSDVLKKHDKILILRENHNNNEELDEQYTSRLLKPAHKGMIGPKGSSRVADSAKRKIGRRLVGGTVDAVGSGAIGAFIPSALGHPALSPIGAGVGIVGSAARTGNAVIKHAHAQFTAQNRKKGKLFTSKSGKKIIRKGTYNEEIEQLDEDYGLGLNASPQTTSASDYPHDRFVYKNGSFYHNRFEGRKWKHGIAGDNAHWDGDHLKQALANHLQASGQSVTKKEAQVHALHSSGVKDPKEMVDALYQNEHEDDRPESKFADIVGKKINRKLDAHEKIMNAKASV